MTLSFLGVFAVAQRADAHPGHAEDLRPILGEEAAKASAQSELGQLVVAAKVDATWKGAPLKGFTAVSRQGHQEWLAAFENAKAKGKPSRELFLMVNVYGDAVAGGLALSEADGAARAKEELARLVAIKKLPASWSSVGAPKLEKRTLAGHWEWVATFDNPAEATNKRVYVFLWPYGEFAAANFTGK